MSRVGWSLNLPPNLDHFPFVRHSSILCGSSPATYARLVAGTSGRSCFLVRPSRDRGSSRAHVRTNAARARTCRERVVSASIRRIQFLKGNHRRPLWGKGRRKARSFTSDQISDIGLGSQDFCKKPSPLPAVGLRPSRRRAALLDHRLLSRCSVNETCRYFRENQAGGPSGRQTTMPPKTPAYALPSGPMPMPE